MPRHARFIVFAIIAVVVASCATVDTAVPTAAPSARSMTLPTTAPPSPAAATPAPTQSRMTPGPTAVPAPTPTAVPSDADAAFLSEGGSQVFPGRYIAHLKPQFTLTVDRQVNIDCAPGYRCRGDVDVNLPDWLDIEFGHDDPIELHVMAFDQVFAPTASRPLVRPPDDLAAWIAAMPGVTIIASKAITVGGIHASQLDLRTGDEDLTLGPIAGIPDISTLGFGPHQIHRVDVLHVGGRVVVIGLGLVRTEDSTREEVAAAAAMLQPIVDSIAWQ
jgi:hypothetical protein